MMCINILTIIISYYIISVEHTDVMLFMGNKSKIRSHGKSTGIQKTVMNTFIILLCYPSHSQPTSTPSTRHRIIMGPIMLKNIEIANYHLPSENIASALGPV